MTNATTKDYVLQVSTAMQLALNEKEINDACNLGNKNDINTFLFNLKNLKTSSFKPSKNTKQKSIDEILSTKLKKIIHQNKTNIASCKRSIEDLRVHIANYEKEIKNLSSFVEGNSISSQIQDIEREGFWKLNSVQKDSLCFLTRESVKIPFNGKIYHSGIIKVLVKFTDHGLQIKGATETNRTHSFINSREGLWGSICFGSVTTAADQALRSFELKKLFHLITLLIQSKDSYAGYSRHEENLANAAEVKIKKKPAPRAKRVAKKNVSTSNSRR